MKDTDIFGKGLCLETEETGCSRKFLLVSFIVLEKWSLKYKFIIIIIHMYAHLFL